eukprot:TRINITY_DN14370_c0_g1_i4.p1 TRINITY_DN14370_c0_g1~~TRINITY_DN14370_c0_g1_i4.p1  ORF type:complete len:176 (-),score=6.66 TRINITY_DN14370_c0_g1_i4:122-649(-)
MQHDQSCCSRHDSAQGKPYFVEIWDVGGQARYKKLRSLFYRDINGVVLVYDLANSWSLSALHKWAEEIARKGTFVAPLPSEMALQNFGGLPVPLLIVANKSDLIQSHKSSAVYQIKQLVQRILGMKNKSKQEQIKRSDSIASLVCSAQNGDVDQQAFQDFFQKLIQRKFYGQYSV